MGKPITLYTSGGCSFCMRAKQLLKNFYADTTVVEIAIDRDQEKRIEMLARAHGARTVPQIFIEDLHIGGFQELEAKHKAGELAALLV